jgi:glycosyltransferase involved in cell wall biosynthesis
LRDVTAATALMGEGRLTLAERSAGEQLTRQGTLLFVVNVAWFFLSHRLALARAAMTAGFDVHLASDVQDESEGAAVERWGIRFHRVGVARGGLNPLGELRSLRELRRIAARVRPVVVHNVTSKPVIYGTRAALASGASGIVNAVSGFGYAYTPGPGRRILRALMNRAYAGAFRPTNVRIIVQNGEDRAAVLRLCPAARERIRLILGSGVDLAELTPAPEPDDVPLVVLPARVLREKGVYEFAAAAAELRRHGPAARFVLAGRLDPANRGALTSAQLSELCAATGLEWLGDCKDMPGCFAQASIVCLPSYREGAPKALLEAAAAGRAIVTTDTPGCRDVVTEGETGLLVPPRDAVALAAAIRRLLEDPELRRRLGAAGRVRAEREFGIERVTQSHLELYRELAAR